MEKKTEQSRITYNKMALEYDSSPGEIIQELIKLSS